MNNTDSIKTKIQQQFALSNKVLGKKREMDPSFVQFLEKMYLGKLASLGSNS